MLRCDNTFTTSLYVLPCTNVSYYTLHKCPSVCIQTARGLYLALYCYFLHINKEHLNIQQWNSETHNTRADSLASNYTQIVTGHYFNIVSAAVLGCDEPVFFAKIKIHEYSRTQCFETVTWFRIICSNIKILNRQTAYVKKTKYCQIQYKQPCTFRVLS